MTRSFAIAGAVAAAMVLAGCQGTPSVEAPTGAPTTPTGTNTSSIDWRQREGEKITLLFNAHPWTDAMKVRLDEFKALTGIEVDLQTYSEDLYWDRYASALRANPGVADVYFQSMDDTAFSDFENDLLAPLTPFLEDPSLTADDYEFDDFPASLVDASRFPSGDPAAQAYGIPIVTETFILYYNKELVDQYLGGAVPSTMADLEQAAKKITDEGGGNVYGAVVRGVRSAGIRDPLTSVVINAIGDPAQVSLPYNVWFKDAFDSPRLDDPAVIDGVSSYAALVAAGPANALALDWPDATALFGQGRAAFFIDSTAFSATFEDDGQSLVAGHVGYAVIPKSSRGVGTGIASWGLGIPQNSTHKEAAWLFIQWATNKANTAEFGQATGGAARISSAEDQGYIGALNPEFVDASATALKHAAPTAVYKEGWSEQMLIIVDAMQAISQGADPSQTMAESNRALRDSLGLS